MFGKINKFLTKLADTIEVVEEKRRSKTLVESEHNGWKYTWYKPNGKWVFVAQNEDNIYFNGLPLVKYAEKNLIN